MEFERHTLAKAGSVVQLATSPTSGDCVLQLLQRRRAAAVVGAWAGAAYDLWRCRKLVQSAALRSQCRMMSAAWNWWSNEVASSAAEAKTPTAVSSAAIEDPSLMDQVGAGTATSSLQKGALSGDAKQHVNDNYSAVSCHAARAGRARAHTRRLCCATKQSLSVPPLSAS